MTQHAAEVCGLPIIDMPDDISPLCALVIVKAVDADGDVAYYARATDGLTLTEALGMARHADVRLARVLGDGDEEWS